MQNIEQNSFAFANLDLAIKAVPSLFHPVFESLVSSQVLGLTLGQMRDLAGLPKEESSYVRGLVYKFAVKKDLLIPIKAQRLVRWEIPDQPLWVWDKSNTSESHPRELLNRIEGHFLEAAEFKRRDRNGATFFTTPFGGSLERSGWLERIRTCLSLSLIHI